MAVFFKNLSNVFTTATSDMFNRSKQVVGMTSLGLKMDKEEENLERLYANLGRLFYKVNEKSPDVVYDDMYRAIVGSMRQVEYYKSEVERVRGVKRCASCEGEIMLDGMFCSYCGLNADNNENM